MTATVQRTRHRVSRDTLDDLETACICAAIWSDLERLKSAAAGGIQDCYDATVDRLGFDPLEAG